MRAHALVTPLLALTLGSPRAAAQTPGNAAQTPPLPQQDPLRGTTFNVTFEGYYEDNANRPTGRQNLFRAYDVRANSFSIQQAALVVENAPDRSAGRPYGLRVDLQFGQATDTLQGNPANEPRPDVYRNVWQAYGSYVFAGSHAVRLDFGKFGSNLGIETNYAKDNPNFSRALLFNFLPFYHMGIRLTVPVNDRVAVMYMLTNGVQQTEDFNEFKSNHFTVVLTPVKAVSWTTSYYFGQEQPDGGEPGGPNGWFRVFDSYVTYSPTDKTSLSFDVNHTTNQVHAGDVSSALDGVGAYARYQLTSHAALALRYEHLADDGLFARVKQNLQELTFTAEGKLADGFLVRGEFRRDWSDAGIFPGRASADPLKTMQNTLLVGLVWWVGTKTGGW